MFIVIILNFIVIASVCYVSMQTLIIEEEIVKGRRISPQPSRLSRPYRVTQRPLDGVDPSLLKNNFTFF